MALTEFQRRVCRLIAATRVSSGESYVAGGVALTELIGGTRLSRDIAVFHDTAEAVSRSWAADRALLVSHGYDVAVVRERTAFVEAQVGQGNDTTLIQWARDSAFRFFPLVEHAELGLALHPFDLATNKVLALVGRLEVRDWIDVIECDLRLQPVGYLAWAAAGKDPGFSPARILAEAARTARYSAEEVGALAFDGPPPDAAALAQTWHAILGAARAVLGALPAAEAGKCVLSRDGQPVSAAASSSFARRSRRDTSGFTPGRSGERCRRSHTREVAHGV